MLFRCILASSPCGDKLPLCVCASHEHGSLAVLLEGDGIGWMLFGRERKGTRLNGNNVACGGEKKQETARITALVLCGGVCVPVWCLCDWYSVLRTD